MGNDEVRSKSEELRLCPFCGGEAELYTGYQIARTGEYLANVRCGKCGITVPVKVSLDYDEAKAEAIEAWNRRAETTVETLMRAFAYDATCGVCDKRKERTVKVRDQHQIGDHGNYHRAMKNDLIKRQDAIDAMYRLEAEDIETYGCSIPEGFDSKPAIEALRALPSADPERMVQVDNVKAGGLYGVFNGNCGWCKSYVEDNYTFCPYCGTRLDWSEG